MQRLPRTILAALCVASACSRPNESSATGSGAAGSTEATDASATTLPSMSASMDIGSTTAAADGCPVDPCDVDEYCDWSVSCGAGLPMRGDEARCAPRPSASECDDDEPPVCGCDGQVHPSACHAAAAGVDVDEDSGCTPPPGTFACGYRFCDPGASYCRVILVDGALNPDLYDCADFPPGCGDTPSCECILDAEACPWTLCHDLGRHFETECPQG
ncbi:MAG: hypothetical protein R3B09_28800 [Nannocystaceae bacterium]